MSDASMPAFPRPGFYRSSGPHTHDSEPFTGMTLRDYFAAKAMQAILANSNSKGTIDDALLGSTAYAFADAMLKAREA